MSETIKARLIAACYEYADQRIATARIAMEQAQAAANEEGKSSAGDKYETGRAMMQIERDKAAEQLADSLKLRQALDALDTDTRSATVRPGSLVISTDQSIFIAIGIGKINIDGKEHLVVGPGSPLGKMLLNKSLNDTFRFVNGEQRIVKIW